MIFIALLRRHHNLPKHPCLKLTTSVSPTFPLCAVGLQGSLLPCPSPRQATASCCSSVGKLWRTAAATSVRHGISPFVSLTFTHISLPPQVRE